MTISFNKAGFEVQTCTRCGGSGHYSYNMMNGTRCFGCGGDGVQYTKRGAAARAFYYAAMDKLVSEIKVGDCVLSSIGLGPKKWFRVESVESDSLNEGRVNVNLIRGGNKHGYGTFATSTLTSVCDEGERLAKLNAALEYQTKLTKMGKLAKKYEVAA